MAIQKYSYDTLHEKQETEILTEVSLAETSFIKNCLWKIFAQFFFLLVFRPAVYKLPLNKLGQACVHLNFQEILFSNFLSILGLH